MENSSPKKFRAWHSELKHMFSVKSIDWSGFHDVKFWETFDHCDGGNWNENVVLMQYTGLKDKNGREIHEGDVLMVEGCIEPQEVYWDGDRPLFRTKQFALTVSTRFDAEVIGNIHQNPELLK